MENEDSQTKETVNFWPGFSDMFLVLFVIVMVAFGTYKATTGKSWGEMQDELIEREASNLLNLIFEPGDPSGKYELSEELPDEFSEESSDQSDQEKAKEEKPKLTMKLHRAAQKLKERVKSEGLGLNLDTQVEIDRKNYTRAILSFGKLVKVKEEMSEDGSFEKMRPDRQLKTIADCLRPGIAKEAHTKEDLEKLLQEKERELGKLKKQVESLGRQGVVPIAQLKQCEEERDRYKNSLTRYKDIFGDLPVDPDDAKKRWEQVKKLKSLGEGTLVFVDEQFKKALAMFMEATESRTVMLETPERLVSAMKKLAESITGGQFDIVNSMLSESEVKFEVARPTYSQINGVKGKEDLRHVYGRDKAFGNEKQWEIARSALLKKVVTGFDSGTGEARRHSKGIVDMLKEHPKGRITVDIIGYTDEDGEPENNNDLGMRRAKFISKIIEILLQDELKARDRLAAVAESKRVIFRCFSAGEFGLPEKNPSESEHAYKARCRRIAVTIKVDSKVDSAEK